MFQLQIQTFCNKYACEAPAYSFTEDDKLTAKKRESPEIVPTQERQPEEDCFELRDSVPDTPSTDYPEELDSASECGEPQMDDFEGEGAEEPVIKTGDYKFKDCSEPSTDYPELDKLPECSETHMELCSGDAVSMDVLEVEKPVPVSKRATDRIDSGVLERVEKRTKAYYEQPYYYDEIGVLDFDLLMDHVVVDLLEEMHMYEINRFWSANKIKKRDTTRIEKIIRLNPNRRMTELYSLIHKSKLDRPEAIIYPECDSEIDYDECALEIHFYGMNEMHSRFTHGNTL